MSSTQQIVTEIEKCNNNRGILQQLCKVLIFILTFLIIFVGIAKGESMEETVPSQEISSNIMANTQTVENMPVVTSQIEQNLEQDFPEKEKQAKSGAIKNNLFWKKDYLASKLSCISWCLITKGRFHWAFGKAFL